MKELRATAKSGVLISDQSNPRFVNQRRGLKRLTGKFPSQLDGRIAPQFRVQEDKQILRSPGFAALHGL
jgi:hypothetical protein